MLRQRSGQALIEYVVLLALASVVTVTTITVAGPQLSLLFGQVSAAIPAGQDQHGQQQGH